MEKLTKYKTKKEAEKELTRLRGWSTARAEKRDDGNGGIYWVIRYDKQYCAGENGYAVLSPL